MPCSEFDCDKDPETNEIIDPISFEPIPYDRLITIKQGNKCYCFDIHTLYEDMKHGRLIHPITQIAYPIELIDHVAYYARNEKLPPLESSPAFVKAKQNYVNDTKCNIFQCTISNGIQYDKISRRKSRREQFTPEPRSRRSISPPRRSVTPQFEPMEISNVLITPPKAIQINYHPESVYLPLRYRQFVLFS